jgi:diacylglycerol kinase family enzyme
VRIALVANRKSGAGDRAGQVERLLRDAGAEVGEPAERVVAAGGDGTLGPAALFALQLGVPFAVVPVGTANSFARWLGVPLELHDAVRLAADPGAPTRPIEVADAGGRPFVNVAATGLSVRAARHARPAKRRLGALAYAFGGATAALAGRPLRAAVTCDGREAWRGEAWQILVAASGAFGGNSSVGGVDPEDHRLDVAIVEAGPRRALLRRAWAMRRGRLVEQRGVRHLRGAEVALALARREFNVDGELLTLAEPRFSVLGQVDAVHPGR